MQMYGKSGCHLQTAICIQVHMCNRSKACYPAYLEHVHVSQNLRSTDRKTLWAATQCVQELIGVCIQLQPPPDEPRAIFKKRNIRHQETNDPLWQTGQAGWYSNFFSLQWICATVFIKQILLTYVQKDLWAVQGILYICILIYVCFAFLQ